MFTSHRLDIEPKNKGSSIIPHVILKLAKMRLFGVDATQKYGGYSLNITDSLQMIQQLSVIDLSLGLLIGRLEQQFIYYNTAA